MCALALLTPPSLSVSSSPRMSGEKRAKESSDEDGEEEKKGGGQLAAAGGVGSGEAQRLQAQGQRLKGRKAKKKQRPEEVDPTRPLMPDDAEQQRVAILHHVKPTQEDVGRAVRGDPSTHPLLHHLLVVHADFLRVLCGENPPPFLLPLVRRCFLSPSPFTPLAIEAAVSAKLAD